MMAPAGTPTAVIEKLNRALNAALNDPQLQTFFAGQSALTSSTTPAEYAAFLKREVTDLGNVIRERKVSADN